MAKLFLILVPVFFLSLAVRGSAGTATDKSDCLDLHKDRISRMAACSRIIEDAASSVADRATGYIGRAGTYYLANDYDQSISDYTEAIRLAPGDVASYNNRGRAFYQKGDYDRAITDYSKAIELNPDNANVFNNRGVAHSKKDDFNQAIADFNEATRLKPRYASAYYNRAITLANKGRYVEAIEDLRKAIDLEPNNSDLHNEIAWTYLRMGNAAAGLPFAERSLALNSNNAKARDTKGAIYEALGSKTKAITEFRQALLIDPTLQSSKDAIKRLSLQNVEMVISQMAELVEKHGWTADMGSMCSTFKIGLSSDCKFRQLAVSEGEPGTINNYGFNVPLEGFKSARYVVLFHLTPLVGSFFVVSIDGELKSSFYRRPSTDYLENHIADSQGSFETVLKFWEDNLDMIRKMIAAGNFPLPK